MVENKPVSNLRLTRSDLINAIIQESAARIYLEIGIKKLRRTLNLVSENDTKMLIESRSLLS